MAPPLHMLAVLVGALAIALSLVAASATGAAQDRADDRPTASPTPTGETLAAAMPVASPAADAIGQRGAAGQRSPRAEDAGYPRPERPLTARVRAGKRVVVRAAPGGRIAARLGATTEFGSRRTLAVVARRGKWLGVVTTARPNNRLGWIHSERPKVKLAKTSVTLVADLSRRVVKLRVGERVVRRVRVTIGRPGSPTPTGTFAVTDKLSGPRFSPYYGCCILALSGTQPNLPPGWRGGNRLAIHGTNAPATMGTASSAGCLHAAESDLRALMRHVPIGTTVTIRR